MTITTNVMTTMNIDTEPMIQLFNLPRRRVQQILSAHFFRVATLPFTSPFPKIFHRPAGVLRRTVGVVSSGKLLATDSPNLFFNERDSRGFFFFGSLEFSFSGSMRLTWITFLPDYS